MKRGAKLGVLLAALLVLVGAWLLTKQLTLRQQEAAQEAAAAEPIDLSVGPADEVTALSWDYFGDTVSLTRDGDGWSNTEDESCPISADAVTPLTQTVGELYASSVIEDVEDFEQYGLAEPDMKIMAATADNVVTYWVGGPAVATGGYYLRLEGEDTVYVADSMIYTVFSDTQIDDLLDLESLPEDMTSLTALTVSTQAGDYALEHRADAGQIWYASAFPWFLLDASGAPVRPVDTDEVQQLCDLAAKISLTDCVSWNMKDAAEYGFDQPQGTVTVTYLDGAGESQDLTLEFGDYDSGDVYVRLAGSRMVYRVSGLTLDGLMYPDLDGMAPLDPCALDWDALRSVALELDGKSYNVVRDVSTPTGEEEEPENIYTLGQRSLDADKVDYWLERLYELKADSRSESPGRDSLFSFTFRQDNPAWPEVTVEFRVYDSVHDLCLVNGQEGYLVSRTTADSLAEAAREALAEPIGS